MAPVSLDFSTKINALLLLRVSGGREGDGGEGDGRISSDIFFNHTVDTYRSIYLKR